MRVGWWFSPFYAHIMPVYTYIYIYVYGQQYVVICLLDLFLTYIRQYASSMCLLVVCWGWNHHLNFVGILIIRHMGTDFTFSFLFLQRHKQEIEGTVLGPRFLNRLLNMLTGDMGVGHNFSKTRHGANENWDLHIKKWYLPKTCLSLPLCIYIYIYL